MTEGRVAYLVFPWVPRSDNLERSEATRLWLQANRTEVLGLLGEGGIYNPEVGDPDAPAKKPRLSVRTRLVKRIDPETGVAFKQYHSTYVPSLVDDYELVMLQMWWLAEKNQADFLLLNEDVLPDSVESLRDLFECDLGEVCLRDPPTFRDRQRWLCARFRHSLPDRLHASWEPPELKGDRGTVARMEAWLRAHKVSVHRHPGGFTRSPPERSVQALASRPLADRSLGGPAPSSP